MNSIDAKPAPEGAAEAPLVAARQVCKTYSIGKHEVPVLRGASLSLAAGQTAAVVGRSGAGKSTLLHILGGLDRPDEGVVEVTGVDLYAASRARRTALRAAAIGFIFQSYHLLPEMDVLENVALPAMALRGYGRRASAVRARARELLDSVGLLNRAHHTPLELSGGEQQRVAMARALINDPQVVFADEPTGNLDDRTGDQVLEQLFAMVMDRGHSLLLVTHNRDIAHRCDRVLHLQDGRLE